MKLPEDGDERVDEQEGRNGKERGSAPLRTARAHGGLRCAARQVPLNVLGPFALRAEFHLEGHPLLQLRPAQAFGPGRDVHEDGFSALRGLDVAEAAFVVPGAE